MRNPKLAHILVNYMLLLFIILPYTTIMPQCVCPPGKIFPGQEVEVDLDLDHHQKCAGKIKILSSAYREGMCNTTIPGYHSTIREVPYPHSLP